MLNTHILWCFPPNFQPNGIEQRGGHILGPFQGQIRRHKIKCVRQQALLLLFVFLHKADRQKLSVALDTQCVIIQFQPHKFSRCSQWRLPRMAEEFIDIVANRRVVGCPQIDKANEPPCPLKIVECTRMQFIRQATPYFRNFHDLHLSASRIRSLS